MLDKLPLFLWKLLLPRIYAIYRSQFWYKPMIRPLDDFDITGNSQDTTSDDESEQVVPIPNIYNCNDGNHKTMQLSNTITAFTALRQTCKYMRDVVLSPKMCEYVLANYQLDPASNFIVVVPRPPKFIKTHWSKHIDHREVAEEFTPVQWIRALTFDIKELTMNYALHAIDVHAEQWDPYSDNNDLSWSVHLTDGVHEFSELTTNQDVEFIGLTNTQFKIICSVVVDYHEYPSVCLRNLNVSGPLERYLFHTYHIGGKFNHIIIDNCTFKGSSQSEMLNVNCEKFAVTNCKFKECYRAINLTMDGKASSVSFQDNDQGVMAYICNNQFDKCLMPMTLALQFDLINQDEMHESVCILGNAVTNPAKYTEALGSYLILHY